MQRIALALVGALVALTLATPSHATLNACSAGKKKCVSKKTAKLLKCHILAEKLGLDPVNDPNIQSCEQKARDKFDGGADPSKGCFAKLEAKFPGGCLTTADTTALENTVDGFVDDVVSTLDPSYPNPVVNACSAGKKKCVSKKATALLKCHAKNEKPGIAPVKFAACLQKARDKFDGGADPSKGCFAKLEAKFPGGGCLTTADTTALENTVDGFVDDVVCQLDAGSGTCPLSTPTATPTVTATPTRTATTTPTPVCTPHSSGTYTDNCDGTVTDSATGLMWEKKTTAVGSGVDFTNPQDVDNTYTWTATQLGTAADGTAFTQFLATLNTTPCFAGHCDWRLPRVNHGTGDPAELETILLASCPGFPTPCIDPIFGPTAADFYWSATTFAANPSFALDVYFDFGYVYGDFKFLDSYVRAVRTSP